MYVTKEDREVIAKTIWAAVDDVYKTPKYYGSNDVILSPAQVSEEFPFITQHFLKRYVWVIPRVRVDKWNDETCKSKFGYSRNLIIELLHSGALRRIKPIIVRVHGKEGVMKSQYN